MTKLSAIWKTHRLGMFYGFLWSFVAFLVEGIYQFQLMWGTSQGIPGFEFNYLVMLAVSLPTGVVVTHIIRRLLSRGKLKWPIAIGAPLSLLLGSMLYVALIGTLCMAIRLIIHEPIHDGITRIYIARLTVTPLFIFTGLAPLLIPLALINTWHLRKMVDRQAKDSDFQGHAA
jgi:hypothetical protein